MYKKNINDKLECVRQELGGGYHLRLAYNFWTLSPLSNHLTPFPQGPAKLPIPQGDMIPNKMELLSMRTLFIGTPLSRRAFTEFDDFVTSSRPPVSCRLPAKPRVLLTLVKANSFEGIRI